VRLGKAMSKTLDRPVFTCHFVQEIAPGEAAQDAGGGIDRDSTWKLQTEFLEQRRPGLCSLVSLFSRRCHRATIALPGYKPRLSCAGSRDLICEEPESKTA
jgi:hypothetical protein